MRLSVPSSVKLPTFWQLILHPKRIIAYRLPEDLQNRAHYLLELNVEGQLTPEERDEMLDFVRVDNMMMLLKAKMKLKLL
jgi:hypothetical protein